eukprot:4266938-Amphidinium_carterae.1
MIARGEELCATSEFSVSYLPVCHTVALTAALLRLVLVMSIEEGHWQARRAIAAGVACIMDMLQMAYVFAIHRENSPFIVSLTGLLILDCIGAVRMRLVVEKDVRNDSKHGVQRFRWRKDDTRVGLGRCSFGDQPCHVCLEELQDGEHVGQLACGHVFHERCIQQWMQQGFGCPLRCQDATCPTPAEEEENAHGWRAGGLGAQT